MKDEAVATRPFSDDSTVTLDTGTPPGDDSGVSEVRRYAQDRAGSGANALGARR